MNKVFCKYVIIILLAYACIFLAACAKGDTKTAITAEKNYSEEILSQVTDIMQEAQKVRYDLDNCSISTVDESKEGAYIVRRLSFAADWNRIREPKDDPLIKGMYEAVDELDSEKEKKAGEHIIDGFLTEMGSEPQSERVKTKIVVKIDADSNQFELFYPHVYEGNETLYPLKEYAQENWAENAAERFQRGKEIIYENITDN